MAGIYIHIPFCTSRCSYCDFYSTTDFSVKDELVACICAELKQQQNYMSNNQIETIYFGGGTPSLLSEANFQQIFETIRSLYDLSACVEITLEANPDDLTEDYIAMLCCLPFNRISIGIQSFQDDELKLINRRHSAQQAIDSVRACQAAGFENISVDIIYGLPSQSLDSFSQNVSKVLEMNIKHVSAYHLTYEEGTVLHRKLLSKQICAVDDETSVAMYQKLIEMLAKIGIQQYEISNFCMPTYESKHNSSYWQSKQYLGVGPSAHSYNGETRKWNISSINDYIKGIKAGSSVAEIEQLSLADQYNDFIITSLRTVRGINLFDLKNRFGEEKYDFCIKKSYKYLNSSNLLLSDDFLKCTQEGFLISDSIISDLFYVE